jgi:phosphate-selective porin
MNLNFVQIRDLYFDLALDKKKEFRLRTGISKVPYGFDVLQSSQNRVAMDRSDALNSGAPNERDMGVFFYWAPQQIRERFNFLVKSGLKGSGDYGVFGLGTYSGQSINKSDLNDNLHVASRVSYPFELKNGQFIETGVFAYTGYFNVSEVKSTNVKGRLDYKDERVGASITVYPQPIGFQAEYTVGRGPEFVSADTSIQLKNLQGGYAQLMYMLKLGKQTLTPYTRVQYYKGGKKHEKDARHYDLRELEMGIEWQPIHAFELTAAYVISKRTFEDSKNPINAQSGNLLRLQAQFNY